MLRVRSGDVVWGDASDARTQPSAASQWIYVTRASDGLKGYVPRLLVLFDLLSSASSASGAAGSVRLSRPAHSRYSRRRFIRSVCQQRQR